MAMQNLGSNQYALEEVFHARVENVFQQLSQLGSRYPLSPLTARLEPLTTHPFGVGSKWREHRRHLFLRDIMQCEVLQCGPRALSIVSSDGGFCSRIRGSSDRSAVWKSWTIFYRQFTHSCYAGFNQLKYDFELNEVEANMTVLHCTVHCYTRPGDQGQYANPSEKLAIMMQSQDRHAIRQLKGAFQTEHTMPVC